MYVTISARRESARVCSTIRRRGSVKRPEGSRSPFCCMVSIAMARLRKKHRPSGQLFIVVVPQITEGYVSLVAERMPVIAVVVRWMSLAAVVRSLAVWLMSLVAVVTSLALWSKSLAAVVMSLALWSKLLAAVVTSLALWSKSLADVVTWLALWSKLLAAVVMSLALWSKSLAAAVRLLVVGWVSLVAALTSLVVALIELVEGRRLLVSSTVVTSSGGTNWSDAAKSSSVNTFLLHGHIPHFANPLSVFDIVDDLT